MKTERKLNGQILALVLSIALLTACSIPGGESSVASTDSIPTEEPTLISLPIPTTLPDPTDNVSQGLIEVMGPQLTSFDMLDRVNGWGITESKLVRTMDGGHSWYDITPPGLESFSYLPSVFFLDELTGWAVFRKDIPLEGTLAITLDGGISWERIQVPFDGGDIKFIDANNGFIMVGRGIAAGSSAVDVYSTTDGGHTWLAVYTMQPGVGDDVNTLPFSGQKSGIGILNDMNIWIGGSIPMEGAVYLYRSTDGGRVWTKQDLTLPNGYQTSMTEVLPPVFFDEANGVLPVRMFGTNTVYIFYQTDNGGNAWKATQPVAGYGHYSIISSNELIVWDGGPTFNISDDGGSSWMVVTPDIDVSEFLIMFDFTDIETGWMLTTDAGNHRNLYHSVERGAVWDVLIP